MEGTLVFPNQLFDPHPAIASGRRVFLVEDPLFFGPDPAWPLRFHAQKLILHRASMKAFAKLLSARGHEVQYLDCPLDGRSGTTELLAREIPEDFSVLHLCDPVDDVLHRRLRRFADARELRLEVRASPNFLSPGKWMHETLDASKKPSLASFYSAQRKRMGVLVGADGKPVGGKWSFDAENRKKLPPDLVVAEPPSVVPRVEVDEAAAYVRRNFPEARGSSDSFVYPVTHRDAAAWLDEFLDKRFALFGDFEDALSRTHRVIYHSVLTPALNTGLLDPGQIVDRALAIAGERDIPINSLEGFIRQVIGWREFIRAIYERHGIEERNGNFWNFTRSLPDAFYDGTTGIAPVDETIRRLNESAYAHHIERLMVLGNFMLLCRIHPTEVYRWFMEMFIDAYDWVMVPNVYGMSQFADGGLFSTKPYLSGSNYIRRMSDYRRGDWCEVWDGLFWSFIDDYREVFQANHRTGMMISQLKRMGPAKVAAHREHAESFLARLDAE